MNITPHILAQRFKGLAEVAGPEDNPQIMAMLRLNGDESTFTGWPESDEVPWCGAFVRYCYWLLGFHLKDLGDLRARSWLRAGCRVEFDGLYPGWDIVVLSRGDNAPGPSVINAPGHVGLYDYHDKDYTWILAGNQGNTVSVQKFPRGRVLGTRRIA